MDSPHSLMVGCMPCAGGTQEENLSEKVFSWAGAAAGAGRRKAAIRAAGRAPRVSVEGWGMAVLLSGDQERAGRPRSMAPDTPSVPSQSSLKSGARPARGAEDRATGYVSPHGLNRDPPGGDHPIGS